MNWPNPEKRGHFSVKMPKSKSKFETLLLKMVALEALQVISLKWLWKVKINHATFLIKGSIRTQCVLSFWWRRFPIHGCKRCLKIGHETIQERMQKLRLQPICESWGSLLWQQKWREIHAEASRIRSSIYEGVKCIYYQDGNISIYVIELDLPFGLNLWLLWLLRCNSL